MDKAVTVLPQPDSPTSPRVSPGARSKLTPATALTWPRATAKWTVRSRTLSSGGWFRPNGDRDFHGNAGHFLHNLS